jgi:hypothetical protein
VALDPVSVSLPDFVYESGQLAVGHVFAASAARTDEVVVVFGRVAHDVCVRAARQVEPLDDTHGR